MKRMKGHVGVLAAARLHVPHAQTIAFSRPLSPRSSVSPCVLDASLKGHGAGAHRALDQLIDRRTGPDP
jgi:hypothetical protein